MASLKLVTSFEVCRLNFTVFFTSLFTAKPSGAPELTPVESEVHDAQSLVFCVVFCPFSFGHSIVCPS
jgi:hypothetical protein